MVKVNAKDEEEGEDEIQSPTLESLPHQPEHQPLSPVSPRAESVRTSSRYYSRASTAVADTATTISTPTTGYAKSLRSSSVYSSTTVAKPPLPLSPTDYYSGLEVVPSELNSSTNPQVVPSEFHSAPEHYVKDRSSKYLPQVVADSSPEYVSFAHLKEASGGGDGGDGGVGGDVAWWCGLRRRNWFWIAVAVFVVAIVVGGAAGGVAASRHSAGVTSANSTTAAETAASTDGPVVVIVTSTSTPNHTPATITSFAVLVPTPTFTQTSCAWLGHCEGMPCENLNNCSSPYPCVNGYCYPQPCGKPGQCVGVRCTEDTWCWGDLLCDLSKGSDRGVCYDPDVSSGFNGTST